MDFENSFPFRRINEQLRADILEAVGAVLTNGQYILGPELRAFEKSFEQLTSLETVGVANGLEALEIALDCVGIKAGDKVLTTPLSAFATTLAILNRGAVPVFVDVDDCGLIDLNQAEEAFKKDSALKAFLPVHLYGRVLDLDRLKWLKTTFDLRIVEDCAQSFGSKFKDQLCGTVGDCAAYSYYPTKNIGAIGDAGALASRHKSVCEKARRLRDYGQSSKYVHSEARGYNSRLDEVQAAIMNRVLLPRSRGFVSRRCALAKKYYTHLSKLPQITLQSEPQNCTWSFHLFPILLSPALAPKRNLVIQAARTLNVGLTIHYPILIPDQVACEQKAIVLNDLPSARQFAARNITLPLHALLEISEVEEICQVLSKVLSEV